MTVGEQTKTTIPLNGDPARIQAEFELENGTYTASGTSEINDETWRTKEKEVTIDGEDAYLSLVLYSPESDELEETEPGTMNLRTTPVLTRPTPMTPKIPARKRTPRKMVRNQHHPMSPVTLIRLTRIRMAITAPDI
ncbi:hypothetical protein ACFQJ8_27740 [Halocatena marina]|uniref:hypothetical protein n=1 Tax=Halocatena marina TaxID=2934937 RepID=UPI0036213B3D